ncbi:7721_t:CDS:2 [Entrophospora sp. SA101]|nr:18010_t:CDS:2 [Entrophospora sp. SA101]CAJ0861979.1 18055_t:CDS:2 [Entrophospora sp. SA101]CAJ0891522.1 7721_t:CDS:2 [Entrophospora sp. SA101]
MGRNNTIDETSEEHQRRLNRERQQRYHRNMDSEGSTGLEVILTSSFLDPKVIINATE